MRRVKRVVLVLVVLVIVLGIVAFVLENQQGVALSFLGWVSAQMAVSVFMILSLIVGLLVGPTLGLLVGRGRPR